MILNSLKCLRVIHYDELHSDGWILFKEHRRIDYKPSAPISYFYFFIFTVTTSSKEHCCGATHGVRTCQTLLLLQQGSSKFTEPISTRSQRRVLK